MNVEIVFFSPGLGVLACTASSWAPTVVSSLHKHSTSSRRGLSNCQGARIYDVSIQMKEQSKAVRLTDPKMSLE